MAKGEVDRQPSASRMNTIVMHSPEYLLFFKISSALGIYPVLRGNLLKHMKQKINSTIRISRTTIGRSQKVLVFFHVDDDFMVKPIRG